MRGVVFDVDGVIVDYRRNGFQPIMDGLSLLHGMWPGWSVWFVWDGDKDLLKQWMDHGISATGLMPDILTTEEAFMLRNRGHDVRFWVTTDSERAQGAWEAGIPALCWLKPPWLRSEARPGVDGPERRWESLTDTIRSIDPRRLEI